MRYRLAILGCLLVSIPTGIVWVLAVRPSAHFVERLSLAAPEPLPEVLTLPAVVRRQTLVEPRHDGPPPWSHGNTFALGFSSKHALNGGFAVMNMNAENFQVIVRELKLETV